MHKLLTLLLAVALYGQTTTVTLTGPPTVPAGGSATVTVSMSGSSGQSVTALQWSLTLPSGVTMGAPTAASAWSTAGDAATCNPANGTCIIAGSQSVMADGVVATIPLTFGAAGSDPIPLGSLFAAAVIGGAGVNVNGMTPGPLYSIKVLSRCDVNSDGIVNAADIQLVINAALGLGACPLSGTACNLVAVVNEVIAANGGACKN